MSSECSICERDTRGPHAPDCPRYRPPPKCVFCGGTVDVAYFAEDDSICEDCGMEQPDPPKTAPTPSPVLVPIASSVAPDVAVIDEVTPWTKELQERAVLILKRLRSIKDG